MRGARHDRSMAAECRRRCSGYCSGLRATEPSAKGRAGATSAHRGFRLAGDETERGRRRGPAAAMGRCSRRRALQVFSVLLDSTDRRVECLRGSHSGQGGSGVAGGEESGGGPNSPTAALDEIPARVWTKVGAAHSVKVLGTRWSCYVALGWLRRGGAARPRRRKEIGTTEQSGWGGS